MIPALGEFLGPARRHITAALSCQDDLPGQVKCGVISELDRLAATLARYFSDFTLPDEFDPASTPSLTAQPQATLHARRALRRAAASLRPGAQAARNARPDAAHPVVRHLATAADFLAAGRDLLQTHFLNDPEGTRSANSWRVPIITSPTVTTALAAELADHAHQLAPWASRLALSAPGDPAVPPAARIALHTASHWLWIAGTTMQAATRDDPPPPSSRELLDAIPANIPPHRWQPHGSEPVPELCEGAISTAERLRHANRVFSRHARWSPASTAASWRRDARAIAIIGHSSELILRTLADRAGHLGTSPAITASLRNAADATAQAWEAWRAATRAWDTITTSRHPLMTPVAAEIGDLVLWTGRLAYHSTQWTPARGCVPQIRDPSDLAPAYRELLDALAAVHHATDAVTRIGLTDRKAVRVAAADMRLHVTTRSRPADCDIPHPYAPAPRSRIMALLSTYNTAINASKRATAALDELADALNAPTRMLAATHVAAPRRQATKDRETRSTTRSYAAHTPVPWSLPSRQAEETVRILQISEPALLARAIAVDEETKKLIAEATAKSRRRDTASNAAPTGGPGGGPVNDQPARVAAQDLPQQDPLAYLAKELEARSITSAPRDHTPVPIPHPRGQRRHGAAN